MKGRNRRQERRSKNSVYFASMTLKEGICAATVLVDVANSRHNMIVEPMPFPTGVKHGEELEPNKIFPAAIVKK